MPTEVTRVFHTPEFVRGIVSLRGTIVCVLDLGRLLGLESPPGTHRRFLVVRESGVQAAIPVHDVFRVPEIPPGRVETLPPSIETSQRAILEGVLNTTGMEGVAESGVDTLTLLDVRSLFEAPQVAALRGRR
jgi:purine-binding chemotaxis protein CheW